MAEGSEHKTYEQTVEVLNTLQTNAQVIAESRRNRYKEFGEIKLQENVMFLNRVGIKVEDIDVLNPIHIAGTKGKGSVCAMCESILRAHGYKTGFVSSPHLLEVRERIRINGEPISKELFVKYFWECYNSLSKTAKDYERKLPPYFAFLNVMSFKVFLEEKVDVAVVEVGIGGSYDATNIMRRPKVCGVTSLGYDHTDLLGKTIKEIAWHKAGIFKPGVPAFTASQTPEGLEVIKSRAEELKVSSLMVSPGYSSYPNPITSVGIHGEHQLENASLAAQICKSWLEQVKPSVSTVQSNGSLDLDHKQLPLVVENDVNHKPKVKGISEETGKTLDGLSATKTEFGIPVAEPFHLSSHFHQGLQNCRWPGRCQVIQKKGVSYFVDGAHTNKSLKFCVDWFKKVSLEDVKNHKNSTIVRVLLFNFSGKRDAQFLMQPLIHLDFDYSLFCPNIIEASDTKSSDQTNLKVCSQNLLSRCQQNALLWKQLHEKDDSGGGGDSSDVPTLSNEPLVFNSISDAVKWVGGIVQPHSHVQVLVCGSLYLVGGVLAALGFNTDTLLHNNKTTQ